MAYLRLYDYYQQIQSQQLNQITTNDPTVRLSAELKALEEVASYLSQKYEIAKELSDTLLWSPSIAYKAKQRIYLDASAYSASATYAINDLSLEAGNIYICTTAVTSPEAFDSGKWTLIGLQNALYFVKLPNEEFNYQNIYAVGDIVFWKDKVYTAVKASTPYSHEEAIQYGYYGNLPYINVFPDDIKNGSKFWGTGVAYEVAAGTLPNVTAKWTFGDNRSQKILECLIDITLYKLHHRVAPNNIPQIRIDNYDNAILWLKACAKGAVTSSVEVIQPKQGRRIRYGGPIKNVNSY